MKSASRTVRKLRLRAPDEGAIQRAVVLFEDALRTASLPNDAGRIVIVRRLALGRIDTRVAPQLVALRLERAFAHVIPECVYAGSAGAPAAPAVWFRDALDAHTRLALRLAAGEPVDAWYWKLAVKAWQPGTQTLPLPALRGIMLSLAVQPEAPAALPQWTAALAGAGHTEQLVAALEVTDVPALARAAGLRPATRPDLSPVTRLPHPDDAPNAARAQQPGAGAIPVDAARPRSFGDGAPDPRRALVRALLVAAGAATKNDGGPPTFPATGERQAARRPGHPAERTAIEDGTQSLIAAAQSSVETARADVLLQQRGATGGEKAARDETSGAAGVLPIHPRRDPAFPQWVSPDCMTHAGGLLFLIPVLQRLGYAEWLEAEPAWERCDIARHVLAVVLTRLQVGSDDPAWQLAHCPSRSQSVPRRFAAPACWHDGLARKEPLRRAESGSMRTLWDASGRLLLSAWTGDCPPPLLEAWRRAEAMSARSAEEELPALAVAAWVHAARRWLRRCARIGLADLVLRRAIQSSTPTHADVDFERDACELRVRRAGLDFDPGWVPWFGRVVTFHYR